MEGKNFYHEILYLTADCLKLGFHFIDEERDRLVFTFDCIPQNEQKDQQPTPRTTDHQPASPHNL